MAKKYLFSGSIATLLAVMAGLGLITRPALASGPDLEVSGVVRSYTTPSVGDAVKFDIYIKNAGDATAPGSQTRFRVDYNNDGNFETTLFQPAGVLSANDSEIVTFFWTPTVSGIHRVESCTDSSDVVSESNESNNCSVQIFNVDNGPQQLPYNPPPAYNPPPVYSPPPVHYPPPSYGSNLPDLAVSNIVLSPNFPTVDQSVSFAVYVRNDGQIAAGDSQTNLKIDLNSDGNFDIDQTKNTGSVSAGGYQIVYFSWGSAVAGNHRVTVCADSNNSVAESNESNNCLSQYINVTGISGASFGLQPIVYLSSVPSTINPGGSSVLVWSSYNATNCYATEGWSGYKPLSGTETVSPNQTRSYTLNCYNSYGQNSANTTVYVGNIYALNSSYSSGFIASCVANPEVISPGRSVTFAAGQSGASGTIYYAWSGAISGSDQVKNTYFNSPGVKTAYLTITDSTGHTANTSCQARVIGAAKPTIPSNYYYTPSAVPAYQPAENACTTTVTITNGQYCNGKNKPVIKIITNTNNSADNNDNNDSSGANSAGNNYTTEAKQVPDANKATALVLSFGLDGTGRFFAWTLVILFNLFLVAAFIYLIKMIGRQMA